MPIKRPCDECGTTYLAKSKTSRYCETACRVRANRRPSKQGAATAADAPAPVSPYERGGLLGQVVADLTKANVLETIPGKAALALAYRIESPMETGSAAASMTRELSRLVEEAKALAPKRQDAIDALGDGVGAKLRLVQ